MKSTTIAVSLGLLLTQIAVTAQARTEREHVLLARQVEVPGGDPPPRAITVLVHNQEHPAADRPACFFRGALSGDLIDESAGAGSHEVLFLPLDIAPGGTLAIDLPAVDAGPAADASTVFVVRLFDHQPGHGPCPLHVQVLGVDDPGGATGHLIHRFTVGFERAAAATAQRDAHLPVGFVGGTANQRGRVTLIADSDSPLPREDCELPGALVGRIASRLDTSGLPDGTVAPSFENAWPIHWAGPDSRRFATVDIDFAELGASELERIDALISVRFEQPAPFACRQGYGGGIVIFDFSDPDDPVGAAPSDRVYFNFNHFHSSPGAGGVP